MADPKLRWLGNAHETLENEAMKTLAIVAFAVAAAASNAYAGDNRCLGVITAVQAPHQAPHQGQ